MKNSLRRRSDKNIKRRKKWRFSTRIRLFEVKMHLYPCPCPLHCIFPCSVLYRVFHFLSLLFNFPFVYSITHSYHLFPICPPPDLVSIIPSSLLLSLTLSSHFVSLRLPFLSLLLRLRVLCVTLTLSSYFVSLYLPFCLHNHFAFLDSIIPSSLIVSIDHLLPLPSLLSSLSPNFKLPRGPGIDSKESIPPPHVA